MPHYSYNPRCSQLRRFFFLKEEKISFQMEILINEEEGWSREGKGGWQGR